MEHPNVEPTSDEELQFMEDVEFLHSQLITVGDPVDANFAKKIIRSIGDKSLIIAGRASQEMETQKIIWRNCCKMRIPEQLPVLKLQLRIC